MKRLLPGRIELAVFAVAAIICAAIVTKHSSPDILLALLAMPLFVVCAFLGMSRKPVQQSIENSVEEMVNARRDDLSDSNL